MASDSLIRVGRWLALASVVSSCAEDAGHGGSPNRAPAGSGGVTSSGGTGFGGQGSLGIAGSDAGRAAGAGSAAVEGSAATAVHSGTGGTATFSTDTTGGATTVAADTAGGAATVSTGTTGGAAAIATDTTGGATNATGTGEPGSAGREAGAGGSSPGGDTTAGGADGGAPTTGVAPTLAPVLPVPTEDQAAWQRRELTAFFHFGLNTFTDVEWGTGSDSPALFNPTELDAAQWVRVMQEAGFRQAIIVAKHHDGFCLWPSAYTDYSVENSPWRGGEGDLVAEFTEAARAADLKVGLYLSPWDRHEESFGSPAYDTYFESQLTELLSNYGTIDEVWLDGAGAEEQAYDWDGYYRVIRGLQPHALIAITGPDIRWVGNEDGIAPLGETSVQVVDGNLVWYPAESDVSIRPGWFYHEDEDGSLKSLDQLLDIYFKSVGRNATLLLNIPPDPRGLVADADIARLREFSAALDATFSTNLAAGQLVTADSTYRDEPTYSAQRAVDGQLDTFWAAGDGASSGRLEVDLGAPREFNLLSLREPIELGERTTAFHVEVEQDGAWQTVATGTTIGQRNLLGFGPRTAQKLALVVEEARGVPAIAELGVFLTSFSNTFASGSLLAHKPVQASNVHPAGTGYGGDKAIDDDMQTRWATSDGTAAAWLEVDLERVESIGRMEIDELDPRITAFELQYRVEATSPWETAYTGAGAGEAFSASFAPVSARYVRLDIRAATNSPTIWEFRVFAPEP